MMQFGVGTNHISEKIPGYMIDSVRVSFSILTQCMAERKLGLSALEPIVKIN